MSDKKKVVVASGIVQQFPDTEVVTTKDVSGSTVRELTIKTSSQKLIRVSVWDRHDDFEANAGDFVWTEGAYSEFEGKNGTTFRSISSYSFGVLPAVGQQEREVVNKRKPKKVDSDTAVDEESF